MARIDIRSNGGGGTVSTGVLQLENGVAMDTTLRNVADQSNTTSPLKLSTTAVQVTSPLRITTSDASGFYLDAEDSATNNRFSIKRDPSAQEVTLDFASNPSGSTTLVGAIRTYRDGVNLSAAMSFIEDGSIGVGTSAPVGLLDLFKSAAATRLAIRGDAGQNRLISYRTGALQRFGLYVNNTAESGSNAGSNFAIRAYSDAGTLLTTPFFINRATGNVGVNTLTGTAKLQVVGSGSTSATTSFLVQNSLATQLLSITDDGVSTFSGDIVKTDGTTTTKILANATSGSLLSALIPTTYALGVYMNRSSTYSASNNTVVFSNVIGSTSGTIATAIDLSFRDLYNLSVKTTNIEVGSNGIANTADKVLNILTSGAAQNQGLIRFWDQAGFGFIATMGISSKVGHSIRNFDFRTGASDLDAGTLVYRIFGASNNFGIGASSDVASAKLNVESTTSGFLPPRMTNAQRGLISTPAIGLMVYCTDAVEGLYVYKSTGWTFVA